MTFLLSLRPIEIEPALTVDVRLASDKQSQPQRQSSWASGKWSNLLKSLPVGSGK